jgi:NO-binding membrane sensor protein with MHYT domain
VIEEIGMYEIWLGLNILFELALPHLSLLLGVLGVWVVLMIVAFSRRAAWRRGLSVALGIGVAVGLIVLFALPGLTRSSMAEVAYLVDWLVLIGIAAGCGVGVAVFVLPLAALFRRSAASR